MYRCPRPCERLRSRSVAGAQGAGEERAIASSTPTIFQSKSRNSVPYIMPTILFFFIISQLIHLFENSYNFNDAISCHIFSSSSLSRIIRPSTSHDLLI